MSEQLYNTRILRLAANIPHQTRLAAPHASVTKVSPICGSKITVDVMMDHGRVQDFGQEVRACALGQASASILGAHILGKSAADLSAARDALRLFLTDATQKPGGEWADYDIFEPAIPHRSRHGSIMLALEAAAEAAAKADG